MTDRMTPEATSAHWRKTRALMWSCLAVWALFSFVVPLFAGTLNQFSFLGFPLGFFMAAQGSLVVFVALVFWFAARQNTIDEEFGAAED
jgi:putative solute:sodium symporter small subunit